MNPTALTHEQVCKLAHDLRSPVASMQSFLNILRMDDYQMPAEELRSMCVSLEKTLDSYMDTLGQAIKYLEEHCDELTNR